MENQSYDMKMHVSKLLRISNNLFIALGDKGKLSVLNSNLFTNEQNSFQLQNVSRCSDIILTNSQGNFFNFVIGTDKGLHLLTLISEYG